MSEGSLVGILGHVGSCNIGSFVILLKSRILRDTKYGMGGVKMVMREINEQETCITWAFTIYLTIVCNQMSIIHKSIEKKHTCG
jgi:hypothetical protein